MQKEPSAESYDALVPEEKLTFLEIDAYIGLIAMEFNDLEILLLILIRIISGTNQETANAIWHSAQWSKRIDLIDSIFRSRGDFEEYRTYWSRLLSFLKEIGGDRNFVIHGTRMQTFHANGKVDQYLIPNELMGYESPKRKDQLSIADLGEIIFDIRAAHQALAALQHSLIGLEPSPDTLAERAVRRRFPRHRRKAQNN